jgi:aspartyl-tRNA(Asn)/glutamyl-tRNA(Gln) amidotransferase subunit A
MLHLLAYRQHDEDNGSWFDIDDRPWRNCTTLIKYEEQAVTDEIAYMTATQVIKAYADKDLSPVEVTGAALDRIEKHNGKVNAFCFLAAEEAIASAHASEERWSRGEPLGLMDGVPTSIKDLNYVKGWPTGRGSLTTEGDPVADVDAPLVARFRESGAVLLGKTTTPEYGWKGVTDSLLTGITRNPWNLQKTPGGSSGGASAALASGMGQLAQGSDGGGSIRIPCGFSGLPGLKPSYGRVPVYPASPFGTLSHVGPMARSVEDLALMLNVMSLPDSRDWLALPWLDQDWNQGINGGVEGLRIAWSPNLGYADVDPEVARIVADAVTVFSELGANVEACDPGFDDPTPIFRTLWWAGCVSATENMSDAQKANLEPALQGVIQEGGDIGLRQYLNATMARAALGQVMNHFHDEYHLLVTPTLAVPAFDAGQLDPAGDDDPLRWLRWTPFSYPFNMTGQPAVTVPCGFTDDGLPVGLQIVGPMHRDDLVLKAARAFEAVRPQNMRPLITD